MRVVAAVEVLVVVAVVALASPAPAHADKALAPYAGQLVISPDPPPPTAGELPGYLKANASKDRSYELIKGPPWPFHVVAVLGKPAKSVTLVVTAKADPKAPPLLSVPFTLAGGRKLLLAHAEATIAAGFAASTTYVVRLLAGTRQLARAELTLRD